MGLHDRYRVLVVEDDPDIRRILQLFLSERDFAVTTAESATAALDALAAAPVDLILSDVRMPGMSGIELLHHIKGQDPDVQLVLMTAYSSVKDAVEAIQAGATDYIEKPIDFRRLERILDVVFERRRLRSENKILQQRLQGQVEFHGMIARSQEMLEIFSFIERLARYPTTALITGESGTGKELVARALHDLSPLRERPLVTCNCTTLAPTLLESELFGHVRGAFTGADRDRKGLFESAHGGSIFLDEIGELSPAVQAKLLRVIENREIKRVGSPEAIRIDIRIIAATNRDLDAMVETGEFREDLYYRLNVGAITLPPLRRRIEDVDLLCDHFLARLSRRLQKDVSEISEPVLQVFRTYSWPGNIRELLNVIERALIVAHGPVILPEHLPVQFFSAAPEAAALAAIPASLALAPDFDLTIQAAERDQIRKALEAAGGKRMEAARLLGLSRRTLYRKLEKYGIS
ncbi:MAG: sigma-54-dependent Fis family transcriptional regulator [Deltaproteobacteria bacterium]|nr:sigma-54-dependent Fis family transcriptional regulator [Deltaproteobacteria bacterium]